jgi:hypothetical protein
MPRLAAAREITLRVISCSRPSTDLSVAKKEALSSQKNVVNDMGDVIFAKVAGK